MLGQLKLIFATADTPVLKAVLVRLFICAEVKQHNKLLVEVMKDEVIVLLR